MKYFIDTEMIKHRFMETMKNTSPSQFTEFIKSEYMHSNDPVEEYFWDCAPFIDEKYPLDTTEKIYLLTAAEFFYNSLYGNEMGVRTKENWEYELFPVIYFNNIEPPYQFLVGWNAEYVKVCPQIKLDIFELFYLFSESFYLKRSSIFKELKKQSNNDFKKELL